MNATSSAYPKGTETVVVKVTLSREHYEHFKALGDGYATRGIREALARIPIVSLAPTKGWVTVKPKAPQGRRARSHCKWGHPLEGTNLYISQGKRRCKVCRKRHAALRWDRQPANRGANANGL